MLLTPTGLLAYGRRLPCTLGRTGLTHDKREGDGATPVGDWTITGMLYRPDRMNPHAMPGWASPIGPRDLWCDAPDHPDYNQPVRAPFPASHERLRRADPLYDLVLTTDWNWPDATPGRGSAIFLHRWRRPGYPTAGCLAFAPEDLHWLALRVQPGTPIRVRG
ncbi:MAG: L,D-transpeptidase family protein [Rhodobacter sp.]|nr:L,D-transpeptidase family protein [Rhodobacter sp.]